MRNPPSDQALGDGPISVAVQAPLPSISTVTFNPYMTSWDIRDWKRVWRLRVDFVAFECYNALYDLLFGVDWAPARCFKLAINRYQQYI